MSAEVYTGFWIPRTISHLQEFFEFLNDGNTSSSLNKNKLDELRNNLQAKNVKYTARVLDLVTANLSEYNFNYLEDGVIFLSKSISNFEDVNKLENFVFDKFMPAYDYLYSKGAPIPKNLEDTLNTLPIIYTTSSLTEDEISSLFKKLNDKLDHVVSSKSIKAYIGGRLIILLGKNKVVNNPKIIRSLLFTQEFNNQLNLLLNLHRKIWDEISIIREKKKVRFKDLPLMRDLLLDVKKDVAFVQSRLSQMDEFLQVRSKALDSGSIENKKITKFIQDKLTSLSAGQTYQLELWKMTDRYADSTQSLISLLYQENEQNEINTLQVIFMIGVIASLLTLGAMPTSEFTITGPMGIKYIGQIDHFDFKAMLEYGFIAFILSAILYILLHFAFTRIKKFRIVDLSKLKKESFDDALNKIKE